jgi:hypothetical protein
MKQRTAVDGLFEVIRARVHKPAHASDRFILICRKGRLFGADPQGRVCTGELAAQSKHAGPRTSLRGTYKIPLRRRSGHYPARTKPSFTVPITGEIDPCALSQNATVLVGGKQIDIQITYLGPLPSQ